MNSLLSQAAGTLVQLQQLAVAGIMSGLLALGLRSCLLTFLDRGRPVLVALLRLAGAVFFLSGGFLYGLFTASAMIWDSRAIAIAVGVALLALAPIAVRRVVGGRKPQAGRRWPSPTALLIQLCLLLALLLVAALTLMRAGFLALTEDRPVMLLEVTGETALASVRWAPPDAPLREERLTTHRVVFRTPEGERVAETWMYGDQVAVKGRVLRLTPILNAAGVPNLFELQFAHNGYLTVERHNTLPHAAVPLPPTGPLAVHPWWRPLQRRLLERWEKGAAADPTWAVRSVATESTYFPLVDSLSQPIRQTYRLMLTPGGLSSS